MTRLTIKQTNDLVVMTAFEALWPFDNRGIGWFFRKVGLRFAT